MNHHADRSPAREGRRRSRGERAWQHVRANAVGYLALFVALGGTSYAAANIGSAQIKTDAILTRHIKDGQVTGRDLARGAVGPRQIRDRAVGTPDLALAVRPASIASLMRRLQPSS